MITMTQTEAVEVLANYKLLLDRALEIAREDPFRCSAGDDDLPHLRFEGESAIIAWRTATTSYDEAYCESEETTFPLRLLFSSDEAIAEHRDAVMRDRETKRVAEELRWRTFEEVRQRAVYEALKQKYEK